MELYPSIIEFRREDKLRAPGVYFFVNEERENLGQQSINSFYAGYILQKNYSSTKASLRSLAVTSTAAIA